MVSQSRPKALGEREDRSALYGRAGTTKRRKAEKPRAADPAGEATQAAGRRGRYHRNFPADRHRIMYAFIAAFELMPYFVHILCHFVTVIYRIFADTVRILS